MLGSVRPTAALLLALGLALAGTALGCTTRDRCEVKTAEAVVPGPPPPPLSEVPHAAAAPGMAWIPGHWHWDELRYTWIPGHWASPAPGQRWYPPETVWDEAHGRYIFRAGGFGCTAEAGP
jgi:hypothetical protein